MTTRAFCHFLMTWLYLSLAGAAIVLLHDGPDIRFWILFASAVMSWGSLRRLASVRMEEE